MCLPKPILHLREVPMGGMYFAIFNFYVASCTESAGGLGGQGLEGKDVFFMFLVDPSVQDLQISWKCT